MYLFCLVCDHIINSPNHEAPCSTFLHDWKTLNETMCTLSISQFFDQKVKVIEFKVVSSLKTNSNYKTIIRTLKLSPL